MRVAIYVMMLIMLSFSVAAATIHGTVYNMDLEKVSGVVIEVDTTPNQRFVSTNGSYILNIPNGDYTIKATYNEGHTTQTTTEEITISQDGNYVFDLFLFIDLSEEEDLYDLDNLDLTSPYPQLIWPYVLLTIAIIFGYFAYIFFLRKKVYDKKIGEKQDKDLEKIILLIKKHGGRITQKDLRREIPLSEAKISLMVAELESENKIKKIKKGRGNIICLQ